MNSWLSILDDPALRCEMISKRLLFRFEARTSRGALPYKDTYFITLSLEGDLVRGVGECAVFAGLSAESTSDFPKILREFCASPSSDKYLRASSAIRFGVETALMDLVSGGCGFPGKPNAWTRGEYGIPINGLIWMGDKRLMRERIAAKLDEGYKCLKMKIGAIDFDDEVDLLDEVRRCFPPSVLEIRVDANGAFGPENAIDRLTRLSRYNLHSIEQPIRSGQWHEMADLCRAEIIPIALDEELIGVTSDDMKSLMLDAIRPHYIILKPSLCGGFVEADRWIEGAERRGIGWWATSALESNVGLCAIARWVSDKNTTMYQGLGTGEVFSNNIQWHVIRRGSAIYCDMSLGSSLV